MIEVSKRIKKNMREKQKGITLLALVITIVVLLIIAGISISMLTGDNGTIKQAGNAKLLNEIGTIKEAIDMKDVEKQEDDNYNKRQTFGSITEVLGEEYKKYDKKYAIEAGNIVYKDSKFSEKDIKILEENGIEKESKHYLIMNETTKQSKYEGREEAITLKELQDKITNKEFSGEKGKYNKAYIIEDLDLGATWDEEGILTSGEQWVPITEIPENTVLDGCKHEIRGTYLKNTGNNQSIIKQNKGIIKEIIIGEKNYFLNEDHGYNSDYEIGNTASLCSENLQKGIIKECENKSKITGGTWNTAGICAVNRGKVEKCKNYGEINGGFRTDGICSESYSDTIIEYCTNWGEIKGKYYEAAGILGHTYGITTVRFCINYGDITTGGVSRIWYCRWKYFGN